MNQLLLVKGIFTSPKSTLYALPYDRLLWLSWLAPFYFGVVRLLEPATYDKALNMVDNVYLLFLVFILFALVMIPLGALIVKLVIKLFGKQLTIKKLMNLYGYALVPRLMVALFAYVVMLINPSVFNSGELGVLAFAIIAAGVLALFYSIFLYVYGIVVSSNISENT